MTKAPFIIGISGGSCSGKSTLAKRLYEKFDAHFKVAVISMDNYYNWTQMTTISPIP